MVKTFFQKKKNGFTLVELLLVIGVIGILSSTVVVIIDPVEQLARGRDTTRLATLATLNKAVGQYTVTSNGGFPPQGAGWITELVRRGNLQSVPQAINYTAEGTSCPIAFAERNYCYIHQTDLIWIFTSLEANTYRSQCGAEQAVFVYSPSLLANGDRGYVACYDGGLVFTPVP